MPGLRGAAIIPACDKATLLPEKTCNQDFAAAKTLSDVNCIL